MKNTGVTWNIVYIITVSGRFPENSEILKTLRPHLFACSSSFTRKKRNKIIKDHDMDKMSLMLSVDRRDSNKPSLTHPQSPSWRQNEGCWSWWGWRSVEAFSPRWSETWACSSSPSPSVFGGTASLPHAACLGGRNEAYFSSRWFRVAGADVLRGYEKTNVETNKKHYTFYKRIHLKSVF